MSKKPDTTPKPNDTKSDVQQVAVYIPRVLFDRMADYFHDKYKGKHNVRNQWLLDAIHEKLEREGY